MKFPSLSVILIILVINSSISLAAGKVMVCYYGSWAVYRPDAGKFDVDQIDPFLCTHIIYGFSKLNANTNKMEPFDPWNDVGDDWKRSAYKVFTGLKKTNPALKTLLAIGGWTEGSTKYSQMAANPSRRAIFVQSVIDLLTEYGFDGLDFDWEYPAARGGVPQDKTNFISLLTELKAAFRPKNFMLTAAVSPGKNTIDAAYNIRQLSDVLDQIHVMGYDYHGAWDPYTGHNSPLFGNLSIDKGEEVFFNQDYTINYFIQNGADVRKLVLGMPTYGRGFVLDSASSNKGFYAPARQPIPAGPYTREAGILGYNEICAKFAVEKDWTIVRENQYYKAPYAYNSQNHWLGYDDRDSLKTKAEYVVSKGLLGAMVWSIETDDFRGTCHGKTFPLIKTIVETMNGQVGSTPVAPSNTIKTTQGGATDTATKPSTTKSATSGTTIKPDGNCSSPGVSPDPKDCAKYYQCVASPSGWTVYWFSCGPGTVYSPSKGICDYPYNVPGCENYKS